MTNWYKQSQQSNQSDFQFLKDVPLNKPEEKTYAPEHQEWMSKNAPETLEELWSLLEETKSIGEFEAVLNKFGSKINWERFDFQYDSIVVIYDRKGTRNGKVYIVDEFEYPELKDARQWIDSLYENEIENYIPSEDFNEMFWKDADENTFLYHATQPESVDQIMKKGLKKMDESRGINNRGTPPAVFTSDNIDDIGSYGSSIFAINIGQMKKDGYMPSVEQESPISEALQKKQLAEMIGLEEYYPEEQYASEGLYTSTYVIFGNIPPKYLELIP